MELKEDLTDTARLLLSSQKFHAIQCIQRIAHTSREIATDTFHCTVRMVQMRKWRGSMFVMRYTWWRRGHLISNSYQKH